MMGRIIICRGSPHFRFSEKVGHLSQSGVIKIWSKFSKTLFCEKMYCSDCKAVWSTPGSINIIIVIIASSSHHHHHNRYHSIAIQVRWALCDNPGEQLPSGANALLAELLHVCQHQHCIFVYCILYLKSVCVFGISGCLVALRSKGRPKDPKQALWAN